MLTELDLKILKEFSKLKIGEESSTWNIMKRIFKEGSNKENTIIKRRIRRMGNLGFFKINGGSSITYTLISDNVYYKNFNFPDGRKKGIAVFIDGKWEIYEL